MLAPRIQQAALVALVAAIVMFTNLGGPRLWDRDEPRNAGCAREMLAAGDWIVPMFNGVLRTHKPVLTYWGMMASYRVLGVSEFSARLPSALYAVGTTLLVWFIGRRLFSPQAGVWGAIALATCLMFGVAGRAATPDAPLIFCTTLALAIYVAGTFGPRFDNAPADMPPQLRTPGHYFPQHWPTVIALYAAMGLGVLAKGPVGLVLPTAVIGMFLLIVRLPPQNVGQRLTIASVLIALIRPFEPVHFLRTCWYMRPFTAIFAACAVAVPWYWAVGLATDGAFLEGFFLEHNIGRATQAMEGHGSGVLSVFYYPVAVLFGFFPWSIFALPIVLETATLLRRREERNVAYILAACWVLVFLGAFTLARTKLPSYITPCFPGVALLAGSYIDRWSRDRTTLARWWLSASFGVLTAIGAATVVLLPLELAKHLPGEEALGLLGLTPLATGVACLALVWVRNFKAAAVTMGASAAIGATLLFAVGAQRVDRHQMSHVLLRTIQENSSQPQIASLGILEPSWVFYVGQPIQELPTSNLSRTQSFFENSPEAFLITFRENAETLAPFLPTGVEVLAETPRFLRDENLVVLGRANPAAAVARRTGSAPRQ